VLTLEREIWAAASRKEVDASARPEHTAIRPLAAWPVARLDPSGPQRSAIGPLTLKGRKSGLYAAVGTGFTHTINRSVDGGSFRVQLPYRPVLARDC